jgi:hypothetical protein
MMALGKQTRVEELRREIATLREQNVAFKRCYVRSTMAEAENTRRAVRLREIQAELGQMMKKTTSLGNSLRTRGGNEPGRIYRWPEPRVRLDWR